MCMCVEITYFVEMVSQCRLFDAPSPAFSDSMVKTVFSNAEMEGENLLSVFSPSAYGPSSISLQDSEGFRNDLELDFTPQQEETTEDPNLEELSPSVRVATNGDRIPPGQSEPEKATKSKSFWCSICGKCCVSNKRLKQHRESHSLERPHACTICDLKFKRPSEVTKHMRIHNDSKRYSCEFCQFKTVHKFALDMHLKRHFGDYKYKCDICDKGFYTRFDLTNHTILHSGERPYRCHVCKLTFLYKNNLLYHKKTIHPDPDRAMESFKCDFCDKTYQSKRSLLVHIQKRHSGPESHLCEICGQSVTSVNALKMHKKKSSVLKQKKRRRVLDQQVHIHSEVKGFCETSTIGNTVTEAVITKPELFNKYCQS
ncbi:hypothetical protein RUM43_003431 [Polyplax serrata]|uniref:C2H2-type domain-containing protein n=1 Tax=Polyplax serrata TaxID=468196 RepID=A0AAN8P032_POLSC